MSFDLQIWSTQAVDLSRDLVEPNVWRLTGASRGREGRDWQIVVGASDHVAHEDIPEEVANLLPGLALNRAQSLSNHRRSQRPTNYGAACHEARKGGPWCHIRSPKR
jgi:hypothetical protein